MNAIDESRVSLIIHDIKPPFLDSDVVLSKQIEIVSTVKDPNSAFARYAKAGSETLKEMIKEVLNENKNNKTRKNKIQVEIVSGTCRVQLWEISCI